jgi:hypothetical protein
MAATGEGVVEEHVHGRSRKYMAQVLEEFENSIEPLLGENGAEAGVVQDFKGLVRARFKALAIDANEAFSLATAGMALNGAGQQVRDQLHPVGRP